MKVMICEGDAERAKVLNDLLHVYRLKLITINRNSDLLKQIENHKPAIIILNEKFAPKLGTEIITRLRSNPVSKGIPIIFISESGHLTDSRPTLSSDSLIAMMQEPFKIKYLRHCIDRWTTFRSLHVRQ
jgi:DNA-binding response OmpR family regulator